MLQNREGQRVPDVIFKTRRDDRWVELPSQTLFDGKRVVVFALPGAFTPVCSSSHLPGYDELAPIFRENGIDMIVCMAVNDAFVLDAWQKAQQISNITFIPDGNGEFAAGMGMLVDKSELGYGKRSWRYSMLVHDGLIEKMFIEPQIEGDPFEVSDADTMLRHINPNARRPHAVALFTREGCPFSARAKALLSAHGMDYEELVVHRTVGTRALRALSAADTVPQVFIDGQRIGGADELEALLAGARSRA